MMLRTVLGLALVSTLSPAAPYAFEAASIKPDLSGGGRMAPLFEPSRVLWRGATLKRLICEAWQVQYAQVLGAPAWSDTERFVVEAKAPGPVTRDELRQMLQALLTERFHLTMEKRIRQVPVLVLSVVPGGPRLQPVAGTTAASDDKPVLNIFRRRATMPQFASLLSQMLNGPIFNGNTGQTEARDEPPVVVLDRTGLTGLYDIALDLSGAPDGSDTVSKLQSAVGLLGLMLDQKRQPLETLAVTHAQRIPGVN